VWRRGRCTVRLARDCGVTVNVVDAPWNVTLLGLAPPSGYALDSRVSANWPFATFLRSVSSVFTLTVWIPAT
jgi:hypothetical protein